LEFFPIGRKGDIFVNPNAPQSLSPRRKKIDQAVDHAVARTSFVIIELFFFDRRAIPSLGLFVRKAMDN